MGRLHLWAGAITPPLAEEHKLKLQVWSWKRLPCCFTSAKSSSLNVSQHYGDDPELKKTARTAQENEHQVSWSCAPKGHVARS